MRLISLVIFLSGMVFLVQSSEAASNLRWSRQTIELPRDSIVGMPGVSESDTLFRLTCKRGGKLEIGIGADVGIGNGEGEAVAVSASNGSKTVTVNGVSRKSRNWEMTAGTELVTLVEHEDSILLLMNSGKAVTFRTGGKRQFTIPTEGFRSLFSGSGDRGRPDASRKFCSNK